MKNILHKPRLIAYLLLGCVVVIMLIVFIRTPLQDIHSGVAILPGVIVIGGLMLMTQFDKTTSTGFHWGAFFDDFHKQSIARSIAVMNRVGIFLVVLTLYLVYLLVDQTQFLDLHIHPVFIALDETFLMITTVVSGIGLVAYEHAEKEYQYRKHSRYQTYQMVGLSVVLSIITGLILVEQVSELGWIGIVIANIAMVLVFLVGVMLMEEEE